MEEINLPESLHSLEEGFEDCKSLKHINISERVGFIKKNVFNNNISLKDVKLPKYVAHIDESAFSNCPNVQIDNSNSEILFIHEKALDSKKALINTNISDEYHCVEQLNDATNHELIVDVNFWIR